MNCPPVFLPMEVKVRDVEPRCYLGLALVRAGHPVVLGRKTSLRQLAETAEGRIVWVDKGLVPGNADFYRTLKEKGSLVVQLHEEGGVIQKSILEKMGDMPAFDDRAQDHCDLNLMWGSATCDALLASKPYLATKCHVTGHPRYDLFQTVWKWRTEAARNEILLPTSSPLGNPRDGEAELLNQIRDSMGPEADLTDWMERIAYRKEVVEDYAQLAEALAAQFPDSQIVFRPHPGENVEAYEKRFAGIANITVNNRSTFRQQLATASVVVHYDCSTGVEAVVSGAPVIAYNPPEEKNREYCQMLAVHASMPAPTLEDAIHLVSQFVPKADAVALEEWENSRAGRLKDVKRHIANTNTLATERIIHLILEKLDSLPEADPPAKLGGGLIQSLKRKAIRYLVSDPAQNRKFPGLTRDEVDTLLGEFSGALGSAGQEYAVTSLGEDSFLVEPA